MAGNIQGSFFRWLVWSLWAVLLGTTAVAQADEPAAEQQIRDVISRTYDKPEHKVETAPVVVVDGYAIADWVQGERGGRALMHLIDGNWTIMACGADAFKQPATLVESGIPEQTAQALAKQLHEAEQSLSPEKRKQFSLFGTKDDPEVAGHHHHH